MNNSKNTTITTASVNETERLGENLAKRLSGGDVLELVGDLGVGKTQLVRGLARGINTDATVQSPSFMLQRIYPGKPYSIHHFDFYRLDQPGVLAEELRESLADDTSLVAIEWARSTKQLLPKNTITIEIKPLGETEREITISGLENVQRLADDFDD